jgi:hypothetical protein
LAQGAPQRRFAAAIRGEAKGVRCPQALLVVARASDRSQVLIAPKDGSCGYLNQNDAGSGFYKLAEPNGDLPKGSNEDQRLGFWTNEVKAIHDHYR